jgi:hypothetical protein
MASKYISPTGNDTTGTGSIGSPWRTLAKLYANLAAGDTGYCRGGTYVGADFAGDNIVDSVGTSGSKITVINYPGEVPVFDGSQSGTWVHPIWFRWAKYHVVSGLQFTNQSCTTAAIIAFGAGGSGACSYITVKRCRFTAAPGLTINEHGVYLSSYSDHITIGGAPGDGNIFIGAYPGSTEGAGVQVYHTPGTTSPVVSYNIFDGWQQGVQVWDSGVTNASILHNTFVRCYSNIDFRWGGSGCVIRDNAGMSGENLDIYDPNTPHATADHNFWGQTFDANYYLASGQSGDNAASDGKDAGALNLVARSFTANAHLKATQSRAFSLDATLVVAGNVKSVTINADKATATVTSYRQASAGITSTQLFRQDPVTSLWRLVGSGPGNSIFTDVGAPLGITYAYRVDEYAGSSLYASTTLSNNLIASDNWYLSSASAGSIRCYVEQESHARKRQKESFFILNGDYSDTQTGLYLGWAGAIGVFALPADRMSTLTALRKMVGSSQKVYLRSPFGHVVPVSIGQPSIKYGDLGGATIDVPFTQTDSANG